MQPTGKFFGPLVAGLMLLVPAIASADNGSVCVICNEPAKVYQCNYSLGDNITSLTGLNVKGLQFSCIKEIANYGGHGQCAAARRSIENCNGEPYQLRESPPQVTTDDSEALPPIDETDGERVVKKEPPTLVDTTQKTYEQTTTGLKKGYDKTTKTVEKGYKKTTSTVKKTVKSIGSTIGDAASVTYDCVVSLFTECGNQVIRALPEGYCFKNNSTTGAPTSEQQKFPHGSFHSQVLCDS